MTMSIKETRKLINKSKRLMTEQTTSQMKKYKTSPSKLSVEQKKQLISQLRSMTEEFHERFVEKFMQIDKAADLQSLAKEADVTTWYESLLPDLHGFAECVYVMDDEISNL